MRNQQEYDNEGGGTMTRRMFVTIRRINMRTE